jgi:hypothetical protein
MSLLFFASSPLFFRSFHRQGHYHSDSRTGCRLLDAGARWPAAGDDQSPALSRMGRLPAGHADRNAHWPRGIRALFETRDEIPGRGGRSADLAGRGTLCGHRAGGRTMGRSYSCRVPVAKRLRADDYERQLPIGIVSAHGRSRRFAADRHSNAAAYRADCLVVSATFPDPALRIREENRVWAEKQDEPGL